MGNRLSISIDENAILTLYMNIIKTIIQAVEHNERSLETLTGRFSRSGVWQRISISLNFAK